MKQKAQVNKTNPFIFSYTFAINYIQCFVFLLQLHDEQLSSKVYIKNLIVSIPQCDDGDGGVGRRGIWPFYLYEHFSGDSTKKILCLIIFNA